MATTPMPAAPLSARARRLLLVVLCLAVIAGALAATRSSRQPPESDDAVARPAGARARAAGLAAVVQAVAGIEAQAPVVGWIVDASGAPIAGVEISTRDPEGDELTLLARTDSDGAFRALAAPAPGTVLVLGGAGALAAEVHWQPGPAPPRIVATRRMRVAARVEEQGRPVTGAHVVLHDGSGAHLVAASDAHGRVVFDGLPPGVYELHARTENAVSPLVRASRLTADGADEADEVVLALAPGNVVRGRLVEDDGRALAGRVTLVPIDVDHAVRHLDVGGDGRFAATAMPTGRWRIEARAPGFVTQVEHVFDTRAAGAEIEVILRRGGVVVGQVVDAVGSPVEGAVIALRGQGAGGASVARAQQVAPAVGQNIGPGRWIHPLAGRRHMPGRASRRFGAARPGTRPAECGGGHCGVDLGGGPGAERGTTVHAVADGVVRAAVRQSRGISGRFVHIEHAGGATTYYIHLDEIRADLDSGMPVRAGEPIGTLGRTGVHHSAAHLHFALTHEHRGRTWFVDPEPMLQHAVVLPAAGALDDELGPVRADAGVLMATDLSTGELPWQRTLADPAPPVRAISDRDGRFQLAGVLAGRYRATAFHAELAPGTSAHFRVGEGVTGEIRIALSAGVEVRGRVTGPHGPVAGARVVAQQGDGESARAIARAITDADGGYRLRALAGDVTLLVDAEGFGATERPLQLGDGRAGAGRTVDFELASSDALVRGRIADPDGRAVAGASVKIVAGPAGRGRRAVTDPYGMFVIAGVPDGSYRLEVRAAGYPALVASADSGREATLSLVAGGAVRVDLRDAHTRVPLAGIRVMARGPGEARATAVTDGDGYARLAPLVVGAWQIAVEHAGYARRLERVEVAPARPEAVGQDVRIEIGRGATIAGTVRDRWGERVAGAVVRAGAATARTDQDGRFRLGDVPTGAVEVVARKDDHESISALELAPGEEVLTLELALD